MNLKISVIIVNFNTKQLTLNCILSVQKYIKNCQIILVDNHSTDGSKEVFSKNKSVKYLYLKENYGFSRANNIGAKYAKGEFLLFLNSDTELQDQTISQALHYYKKNKLGILSPLLLNPDKTIQPSCYKNQTIKNAFKEYFFKQENTFTKYIPKTDIPNQVDNVVGAAILISKKLFLDINGWDEKYFLYYEDFELRRQVKAKDKKIVYYPLWKVIHHHGSTKSNQKNTRLIESSKIYHGKIKYYLLTLVLWLGQKI